MAPAWKKLIEAYKSYSAAQNVQPRFKPNRSAEQMRTAEDEETSVPPQVPGSHDSKLPLQQRKSSITRSRVTLEEIAQVLGPAAPAAAAPATPKSNAPIYIDESPSAPPAAASSFKQLFDWSKQTMIRIDASGQVEEAVMQSLHGAAFQIAVFANGDKVELRMNWILYEI